MSARIINEYCHCTFYGKVFFHGNFVELYTCFRIA